MPERDDEPRTAVEVRGGVACHQAAPIGRPSRSSATTAVSGAGGSPRSSAGSSTAGSGSSSITEASWAMVVMNDASDGSPARTRTAENVPPRLARCVRLR